MTKLATSSGTVIYEDDNKLRLVKKPALWTSTALFVIGLLALIILANGILQLFILDSQSRIAEPVGTILVVAGILFALIFWRVFSYRKKMNSKPFNELECICIIDLNNNKLMDAKQNILAPLAEVTLQRKMQITSSSASLLLSWHTNALKIVEGNPFSGGIEAVENVLIAKGIKRK
jgi:hypothetical protein